MSASGEVRRPPVSREQRDWHAARARRWRRGKVSPEMASIAGRHEALVAAWDAAPSGERPSVGLRETIETHLRANGWIFTPPADWTHPYVEDGMGHWLEQAIEAQVMREGEEGERDE